MPVFKQENALPKWCELESFEIIELRGDVEVTTSSEKEQILVYSGLCLFEHSEIGTTLKKHSKIDIIGKGVKYCLKSNDSATICRMRGHWESVNSGIFESIKTGQSPTDDTPYDYEKTTNFDNHYHDCDEYWVFLNGQGKVSSENNFYEVSPGDCLVTGMGWHHDVLSVKEPLSGVWFETTLEGEKRPGHLWEPKHGKAVPKLERV